ncbi:hypothetical protein EB796_007950 [Bugula neritina]|uniref:G-protein coupled receptors family 1 profile domain-containing protein n=1 Tax=Bugula neritina TaxID=10212 RepID=A0A7J7K736_BUGNE|nr:hypothetical protein EB796_007950 [Bugula neritina]
MVLYLDPAVEPEILWILCFLGALGIILNIINIATLSMSIEQVTYKILLGMAVADLLVNITLFCLSIIFLTRPDPVTIHELMQFNLIAILMRLFASISNWCAVLMATIRLLVVTFPLKAAIFASPRRVKVSIGLIYILCLSLQFLLYPIAVTHLGKRVKEQRMLTFTLLLTLTFFIITYLPLVVYELIDLANMNIMNVNYLSHTSTHILRKVTLILQSCNHTGNFFIYTIANSTLRKNFLQRFVKVKTAANSGRTTPTV